jgi:deazaflavin-dependent oxidoreductase (nitroreductase family)
MNVEPNAFQKLIHRFLMLKPVSAFLAKVLHHADTFLLRLINDHYTFAQFVGLPIIQLTTIGARTGQTRKIPLVGLVDREKIILIASSFGRAQHPAWYYNLKARSECYVHQTGKQELTLPARRMSWNMKNTGSWRSRITQAMKNIGSARAAKFPLYCWSRKSKSRIPHC